MLLLGNHLHEKASQKVKTDKFLTVCTCYLLYALMLQLCTFVATLHPFYMKNALIFSQSEVCNFFMYIILLLLSLLLSL